MQKETVRKAITNINKFYASNLSLVLFLSITVVFSALQIILYLTNHLEMNDNYWNDIQGDNVKIALAWITISMGLISCFTGFIGAIMNMRGSLLFIYFASVNFLCSSVTAILAGAIFMSIAFITSWVTTCVRYYIWKNNLLEKWNLNMKVVWTWIGVAFMITLSSFILIEALSPMISNKFGNIMHNVPGETEAKPVWTWYFDAIGASLIIFGAVILIFKNRMCFVFYFVAKFFAISTYAEAGQIIPIIQMLLFFTTDITGFIAWSHNWMKD